MVLSFNLHIPQTIGAPGPAMLGQGGTDAPRFSMGQNCCVGQQVATQKIDQTPDLLLTFVWDKTASGQGQGQGQGATQRMD